MCIFKKQILAARLFARSRCSQHKRRAAREPNDARRHRCLQADSGSSEQRKQAANELNRRFFSRSCFLARGRRQNSKTSSRRTSSASRASSTFMRILCKPKFSLPSKAQRNARNSFAILCASPRQIGKSEQHTKNMTLVFRSSIAFPIYMQLGR